MSIGKHADGGQQMNALSASTGLRRAFGTVLTLAMALGGMVAMDGHDVAAASDAPADPKATLTLVKTADGNGRVACCEIMVMTGRVRDMILDPELTGQLPEVIAEMAAATTRRVNHLRSAGTTYQGACGAAVARIAAW